MYEQTLLFENLTDGYRAYDIPVLLTSASGAILPIFTAGTSVLWTFGFMAYAGIPINALTFITDITARIDSRLSSLNTTVTLTIIKKRGINIPLRISRLCCSCCYLQQ